jgi:hypothetical protein
VRSSKNDLSSKLELTDALQNVSAAATGTNKTTGGDMQSANLVMASPACILYLRISLCHLSTTDSHPTTKPRLPPGSGFLLRVIPSRRVEPNDPPARHKPCCLPLAQRLRRHHRYTQQSSVLSLVSYQFL